MSKVAMSRDAASKSSPAKVEPARHFSFAVTWTSLTAHLELCDVEERSAARAEVIEIASYIQPTVIMPSSFIAPPLTRYEEAERRPAPIPTVAAESGARWEMVVPKMDRSEIARPERKLAAAASVGRGARALLAAPEAAALPEVEVVAEVVTYQPTARELSLSKIYSALQRRAERAE